MLLKGERGAVKVIPQLITAVMMKTLVTAVCQVPMPSAKMLMAKKIIPPLPIPLPIPLSIHLSTQVKSQTIP